jgi:hypothetical protein
MQSPRRHSAGRATARRPLTSTPSSVAAEPHATAERKRELPLEATRQARQSPLFFDLTWQRELRVGGSC